MQAAGCSFEDDDRAFEAARLEQGQNGSRHGFPEHAAVDGKKIRATKVHLCAAGQFCTGRRSDSSAVDDGGIGQAGVGTCRNANAITWKNNMCARRGAVVDYVLHAEVHSRTQLKHIHIKPMSYSRYQGKKANIYS